MINRPPLYYRCAINLLAPIYRAIVWQRSHNNQNYYQEVADRFGKSYQLNHKLQSKYVEAMDESTKDKPNNLIWCHAVSLGETNTIAPVLAQLLDLGYKVWLTNTTQTGYARGESLFAEYKSNNCFFHSYVPIDKPDVMASFLDFINPCAALFVETELWANTLYALSNRDIPAILVNARLSTGSFKSYKRMLELSKKMMSCLSLIIAQDGESAKRFRQLGANSNRIRVAGSLKWTVNSQVVNTDRTNMDAINKIQAAIATRRSVWVASCTHEGEESVVLKVHQQLLKHKDLENTLLILVPRHPERFGSVKRLLDKSDINYCQRSLEQIPTNDCQVFLADSMGELSHWYNTANMAFIGGSITNNGGHNPVEAIYHSTPVVMGQFVESCEVLVHSLIDAKALIKLTTNYKHKKGSPLSLSAHRQAVEALYGIAVTFLTDYNMAINAGNSGAKLVKDNQKVLQRQTDMIIEVIQQSDYSV